MVKLASFVENYRENNIGSLTICLIFPRWVIFILQDLRLLSLYTLCIFYLLRSLNIRKQGAAGVTERALYKKQQKMKYKETIYLIFAHLWFSNRTRLIFVMLFLVCFSCVNLISSRARKLLAVMFCEINSILVFLIVFVLAWVLVARFGMCFYSAMILFTILF